jgi:sugar phosphate isomerase/epimerase
VRERREFAAGTPEAAGFTGGPAGARAAGLVALAYLTVAGARPWEQIDAAARHGFDAVGLRFAGPAGIALPAPVIADEAAIRKIRARCAATGIRVFDVEMIILDPQCAPAAAVPLMEAAAAVGARYLQVVCEDPQRERASDNLASLAAAAQGYGLSLALEFMRFRATRTLGDARELIETSGAANVGILVDCLHLFRSGGSVGEIGALPAARTAYVQLCDAPARAPREEELIAEARAGRLYPGEGGLPLADLMRALPPEIDVSLEVPRRACAAASIDERARLCAEATRSFLTGLHDGAQ